MYKAQEIADWFIVRSNAEVKSDDTAEPINKTKLQKLMYFAQGINLAVYNERLFDDDFYAFPYGPVSKKIYYKYKNTRSLPEFDESFPEEESLTLAKNYDYIEGDGRASQILNATWNEYSKYTASSLVKMTRDESGPWKQVYNDRDKWISIKDDAIKNYFKKYVVEE